MERLIKVSKEKQEEAEEEEEASSSIFFLGSIFFIFQLDNGSCCWLMIASDDYRQKNDFRVRKLSLENLERIPHSFASFKSLTAELGLAWIGLDRVGGTKKTPILAWMLFKG